MSNQIKESKLKEGRLIQQFLTKFGNDWVMGFASGLAFNLLSAIFPIFIALISIFGLIVDGLDPGAKTMLITTIQNVFPPPLNHQNVLQPALNAIHRNAGFLGVIVVLTAAIGGSGLFVSMEGYLDVIYHVSPRNLIKQYIMAVCMLLFFLVLIPIMVFGATIPALVFSLLRATPLNSIPGIGLLFFLGGVFVGLVISWVFFVVIYIVVPNQRISFRHSWRGAVVAALALQLYLYLFPLYVTRFLISDTGTAGFVVILLFFFYYFAVILLFGAEVNAFFGEHIRVTPDNIAAMIHSLTSHLPTSVKAMQQQASASHKGMQPKDIFPTSEARDLKQQAQKATNASGKAASTQNEVQSVLVAHKARKEKAATPVPSRTGTLVDVLTVAAATFLIEFFRQRRGK